MPDFASEWERCRPYLEAALDHSHDARLEDLREMVVRGEAQFWPALDSAMLTELNTTGNTLHIRLFGGNMDTLRDMLPVIEDYGRALGCTAITLTGRRGWERTSLARERMYTPVATLLRKDLS